MDGEVEWEVEEVADFKQQRNGSRKYLVKWLGTPQRQWLPEAEMIHCTLAIRKYFMRLGIPLPPEVAAFCLASEEQSGGHEERGEDQERKKDPEEEIIRSQDSQLEGETEAISQRRLLID